jgi:transcriptional regulator with XRE-family HTH domain
LSISEVARRADMDKGTLSLLESGKVVRPRPASLRALAEVLAVPVADLFSAADYLQSTELPSLRPYMRAKYHDLPDAAVTEVAQFIEKLAKRHGISEPNEGEDEH